MLKILLCKGKSAQILQTFASTITFTSLCKLYIIHVTPCFNLQIPNMTKPIFTCRKHVFKAWKFRLHGKQKWFFYYNSFRNLWYHNWMNSFLHIHAISLLLWFMMKVMIWHFAWMTLITSWHTHCCVTFKVFLWNILYVNSWAYFLCM